MSATDTIVGLLILYVSTIIVFLIDVRHKIRVIKAQQDGIEAWKLTYNELRDKNNALNTDRLILSRIREILEKK